MSVAGNQCIDILSTYWMHSRPDSQNSTNSASWTWGTTFSYKETMDKVTRNQSSADETIAYKGHSPLVTGTTGSKSPLNSVHPWTDGYRSYAIEYTHPYRDISQSNFGKGEPWVERDSNQSSISNIVWGTCTPLIWQLSIGPLPPWYLNVPRFL